MLEVTMILHTTKKNNGHLLLQMAWLKRWAKQKARLIEMADWKWRATGILNPIPLNDRA